MAIRSSPWPGPTASGGSAKSGASGGSAKSGATPAPGGAPGGPPGGGGAPARDARAADGCANTGGTVDSGAESGSSGGDRPEKAFSSNF